MKRIVTNSLLGSAATATVMLGTLGGVAHAATPASATARTGTACRGIGFTVLHNDRSGGVVLPAGQYRVSSPNLGCKTASNYFTTFLDKDNGAIPGWTGKQLAKGYGTYTKKNSKLTFTVQLIKPKSAR